MATIVHQQSEMTRSRWSPIYIAVCYEFISIYKDRCRKPLPRLYINEANVARYFRFGYCLPGFRISPDLLCNTGKEHALKHISLISSSQTLSRKSLLLTK